MTKILTTYPDEHIEHWAEVYLANPSLRRRGVLFAAFLVAPDEILAAMVMPKTSDQEDYRPLLRAQRKVKLQQDWVATLSKHAHACLNKPAQESSCQQPQ